jgi:large conductance mechanosensitive channel
MNLIQEFKKFAMRGSVVDLAVGIIIGAAFSKIVTSFVNDVIMPPIGLLLGGVDFGSFAVTVKAATVNAPAVVIRYGAFINNIIDFLIVAFAIFMLIKAINSLKNKEEEKPVIVQKEEVVLLAEIRDLLKK